MIYVDTSAFYALASSSDTNHPRAREILERMMDAGEALITTSYAAAETHGLLQHRLGLAAADRFETDVLSVVTIVWVTDQLHKDGLGVWRRIHRRAATLVDCVGIALLEALGETRAFAFDKDFERARFHLP